MCVYLCVRVIDIFLKQRYLRLKFKECGSSWFWNMSISQTTRRQRQNPSSEISRLTAAWVPGPPIKMFERIDQSTKDLWPPWAWITFLPTSPFRPHFSHISAKLVTFGQTRKCLSIQPNFSDTFFIIFETFRTYPTKPKNYLWSGIKSSCTSVLGSDLWFQAKSFKLQS